jgi:alkylation response protein AidB-like acyl-CoA dehydrogenase
LKRHIENRFWRCLRVDFAFTNDHEALRDQTRRFLDDSGGLTQARRVLDGHEAYSAKQWHGLAEMGLLGITLPEAFGGLGISPLFMCVVAEELGRVCAPIPIESSIFFVAETVSRCGSNKQRAKLLPSFADGTNIATWIVGGSRLPTGPHDISLCYGTNGLSGTADVVVDGSTASLGLTLARDSSGRVSTLLVELDSPKVTVTRLVSVDPSRPIARISFENAPFELIGREGDGWDTWTAALDRAAIYTSFTQIGGAQASMEMARDYVLQRTTFGRVLGSYQAVKHRLADIFAKIELARGTSLYAAKLIESHECDLTAAAASARIAASAAYNFAATENIQLHGGIGVTWEAEPNLHYRRARHAALCLGARQWPGRLVRAVAARVAAKELA